MTIRSRRLRSLCACALLAIPPMLPAAGDKVIDASIERIETDDWQLTGLETALEFAAGGVRATIVLERIAFPPADLVLVDTRMHCPQLQVSDGHWRCDTAQVAGDIPTLGRQVFTAAFDYVQASGDLSFEVANLPIAGGQLQLRGNTGKNGSRASFTSSALQIPALLTLLRSLPGDLPPLDGSGQVVVQGAIESGTDNRWQLELDAALDGASLSNDDGTLVADSLQGEVHLKLLRNVDGWQVDAGVVARAGEGYAEPVYANFAEHAVRLQLRDLQSSDWRAVDVGHFSLVQDSLLNLRGDGLRLRLVDGSPLLSGPLVLHDSAVETLYESVLKILAAGSLLGDLETDGRVTGHIELRNNVPESAALTLHDVILDDRARRFAVYGLNGEVRWPGTQAAPGVLQPGELRWDSASVHNIGVGGGRLAFGLGGDDLQLSEPLRLPMLGGALSINQLEMHDYGTDDASGLLDASLEPIQLGQLSGAFGWPAFSGSLSGQLPLLQYQGNAMTVGGSLTARAFDGEIEVANLRVAQPFGRVPRLQGDLHLRGLDLERLTNTFSFGLIQGRLSGDVTGLRMVAWEPVAMDLRMYTPANDRSQHRISQRAVENLASVGGGGAAAALSSGMLKFFEVFAYDRIALRCVLRDGRCSMSGVGPAGDGPYGQGYYIVKGKGIPRIDVVGYRSEVSWPALVRQLENITRSDAPVINQRRK